MKGKRSLLLWCFALPGVIASALLAVPVLYDPDVTPVALETLQVATAVQALVMVTLAVWIGIVLTPRLGLSAPLLEAVLNRKDLREVFRALVFPGLVGGVLGAAVIVGFHFFAPQSLSNVLEPDSLPLIVRVLYGGITEEILLRWGMMSFLVWGFWWLLQRGRGDVSGAAVWAGILLSALLFGLSHVPAVAALMTEVPTSLVIYITVGNALFGVVAGYLFWKFGLEAAIVAHLLAHLVSFAFLG